MRAKSPGGGRPGALSVALRRVLTDPPLRATLVVGGRTVVPAHTRQRPPPCTHARIYQAVHPA
jgi:hypothetical protein